MKTLFLNSILACLFIAGAIHAADAFEEETEGYRCAQCGSSEAIDKKPLKACANCKITYYCSPECQKMGWKDGHKERCPLLKAYKQNFDAEGALQYFKGKNVSPESVENYIARPVMGYYPFKKLAFESFGSNNPMEKSLLKKLEQSANKNNPTHKHVYFDKGEGFWGVDLRKNENLTGMQLTGPEWGEADALEPRRDIENSYRKIIELAKLLKYDSEQQLKFLASERIDSIEKQKLLRSYHKAVRAPESLSDYIANVKIFLENDIRGIDNDISLFKEVIPALREASWMCDNFNHHSKEMQSCFNKGGGVGREEVKLQYNREIVKLLRWVISKKITPAHRPLPVPEGVKLSPNVQHQPVKLAEAEEEVQPIKKKKRKKVKNKPLPDQNDEKGADIAEEEASEWMSPKSINSLIERLKAEAPDLGELYSQIMADTIPKNGLKFTNKDVEKLFLKISQLQEELGVANNLADKCIAHQHAVHTPGHSKGYLPRSWVLHLRLSLVKYGIFLDDFNAKTFKEIKECDDFKTYKLRKSQISSLMEDLVS